MSCEQYLLSNQSQFSPEDLKGLFGQSRFTKEDQAADATQPRTRLVKDVLRVGKWKVGTDADGRPVLFDFSVDYLTRLVAQFKLAKSRQVAFNLCNTHGEKGVVDPRDLIAEVDDLQFDGETLWASFYVTPEQSVYLSNAARKVSVGIRKDWTDGQGNQYDVQLAHIAVVDNPVVTGQKGFIQLSNEQEASMDFAELVDALNGLLAKFGLGKMPEDVDESSLIAVLKTLSGGGHEEEETQEGGMQMSNASTEAEALKGVMQLVNDQNEKIAALSNELGAMKTAAARRDYESKLTVLADNGNITAAVSKHFVSIGEKGNWDLSLLDGLELMQLAPKASVHKRLAKEGSPDVEGVAKEMTDEEVEKLAKGLVNAI